MFQADTPSILTRQLPEPLLIIGAYLITFLIIQLRSLREFQKGVVEPAMVGAITLTHLVRNVNEHVYMRLE